MKKAIQSDEYISVHIQKSQSRFKRIKNPNGADTGIGNYLLILDVTAHKETVYLPLSIASGKKVTGFIYHIEGTATGKLSRTEVSAHGEEITSVTLGTLLYSKIPQGKRASFRIQAEVKGKVGKAYTVVINQINYKVSPTDARYKKVLGEVRSRTLEFR